MILQIKNYSDTHEISPIVTVIVVLKSIFFILKHQCWFPLKIKQRLTTISMVGMMGNRWQSLCEHQELLPNCSSRFLSLFNRSVIVDLKLKNFGFKGTLMQI